MLRRYGRLLVAFFVVSDALLAIAAFGLAYVIRFSSGMIPAPRGYPPFAQYVAVMPFVAALVPFAYYGIADGLDLREVPFRRGTGYDVSAAGGPAYCFGTAHDHQPKAASTMSGRTVTRFNEAATANRRPKA